jgi:hypothetical protein
MPFKVQFVGLVCFVKFEGKIRALMPDGREPGGEIPPHTPFICVANADIDERGTTWPADDRVSTDALTLFLWNSPSQINVDGADKTGTLRTYDQDSRLPRLSLYPGHIKIDPNTAPAIADIPIAQGKLEAFRMPGSDDDGTAPLISQLDVAYDQAITITVTPFDGTSSRVLELMPATEIAFVNVSIDDFKNVFSAKLLDTLRLSLPTARAAARARSLDDHPAEEQVALDIEENDNHFELYGTLVVPPVNLGSPGPTPKGIPRSMSTHVIFRAGSPIGTTPRCSNTGCCEG